MAKKIKVIIKRPGEDGHMTWISDTLENLQKTVGGDIEMVRLDEDNVMIVNDEGKMLDLEPNIWWYDDIIVGTLIIAGDAHNGDLTDTTWTLKDWKEKLAERKGRKVVRI